MEKRIDVRRVIEHYEIYVDGKFKESCDVGELSKTLENLEKDMYKCEEYRRQRYLLYLYKQIF